jgi:hypothetical protein
MSKASSLSKALSRALDANLRCTGLATRLATTALESAFSVASEIGPKAASIRQAVTPRRAASPAVDSGQPRSAAILLEGDAGSTAVGFFVVENSLPHEITTRVEVSPLIAPGGRQIQSALRFDPGTISLAAGEQVVARVTAKISRRLVVGARYQGEILVPGVAGARIPIVLRRKPESTRQKPIRNTLKSRLRTHGKKQQQRQELTRKRSAR